MPFTRNTGLTAEEAEIIHESGNPMDAYAVIQSERIAGRCAAVRELALSEPGDEEGDELPLTVEDVQEWDRKAACILGACVVVAAVLAGIWYGGLGAYVQAVFKR